MCSRDKSFCIYNTLRLLQITLHFALVASLGDGCVMIKFKYMQIPAIDIQSLRFYFSVGIPSFMLLHYNQTLSYQQEFSMFACVHEKNVGLWLPENTRFVVLAFIVLNLVHSPSPIEIELTVSINIWRHRSWAEDIEKENRDSHTPDRWFKSRMVYQQ